jgi:antitoxin (DNA-binding transcriptional repressor) of toxin-antitoxin stability system
MISVNMHDAKTRLSQLVQAALDGEEVITDRA